MKGPECVGIYPPSNNQKLSNPLQVEDKGLPGAEDLATSITSIT